MLRTLRAIMEHDGVVSMRVGVNTGKVFTGDFGPPYRRAYRVFGDAINTAARVMSKADAGQILSTEIVLSRSRTLFATTPIEPFAAKGKSEPVRASIVGPAIGVKSSHRGGVPLIGRDAELAKMLGAIETARGGRAAIVEIHGEPGMGKTRLIEEVVARAPDFLLVQSRCEEYESSTPYFAFRSIVRTALKVPEDADAAACVNHLRDAVERLDPSLAPWIPLLGILLGSDLPDTPETAAIAEQFIPDQLAEVAVRFLGQVLSGSPSFFYVEDIQYLDGASHDLLLRLSRATRDRRLVLTVTQQGTSITFAEPDPSLPEIIRLDLGPLPMDALIAIIDDATEDEPLPDHEVEELARRSGGNSLFLFELLDVVRSTGSIDSLPDSIESMIAGEIDRLSPTDRTILRYAAVLGASFDPELLAQAVSSDVDLDEGVWERLGELVKPDSSGGLRFRNTLIRDAAYEGLPYRRRRALHGRVGEAIESQAGISLDEEIASLALHYHEAQRWDKAWQFCRDAGDRAMGIYANVEATRFYRRALIAGRRLRSVTAAELAALHERGAEAHFRLGEFAVADKGYESARRLLGRDPIRTAPLVVRQAATAIRTGELRRAAIRAQLALHRLDGVDGREAAASRARLLVPLSAVRYFQNRYAEGIDLGNRAIREAERGHARDALAEAYKMLDLSLWESGAIELATHGQLALEIYDELGDVRNQALVLNNMGAIAHDRSRWEESSTLYRRGLDLADKIGDRSLGALMKFNLTEILIDRGLYDEAEPLIRGVIRLWRAAGADADVAEAQRELARLLARRGDVEEARTLLDGARTYQVSAGKTAEVLRTDVRRIESLLLEGRPDDAIDLLDQVDRMAATTDGGRVVETSLARLRGCAYLQLGNYDEADVSLTWALTTAGHRKERFEEALSADGLVALQKKRGRVDRDLVATRAALLREMGISATPAFATGFVAA